MKQIITLQTHLGWDCRVNAEKQLVFPISLHQDLLPLVKKPELKSIQCVYHMVKDFKHSENLGVNAFVEMTGYLEDATDRKQVFHVQKLTVLLPKMTKKRNQTIHKKTAKKKVLELEF